MFRQKTRIALHEKSRPALSKASQQYLPPIR